MALFQTQNLWVHQQAEGVAALVLDSPGKANILDAHVLKEIDQALTIVEAEPRFKLCLLRSKKGTSFCHGVPPSTWSGLQSPEQWEEFAALGQRVCARLAGLRMPTVAVIGGGCLAGGLELALACDWRVALDQPTTLLGFSELDIGLVPGWGAVGRLSRLIALERSLQLLLGGKKLSAREALRWGLVDDLADMDSDDPPTLLHKARKRDAAMRPRKTWRQRIFEATAWGRRLVLRGAQRVLRRRLPDEMPAPWALLDIMRTSVECGEEAALVQARQELVRLGQTAACRNLLRLYLLHEEHRTIRASANRPKKIGVLGATPLALHLIVQAASKGREIAVRVDDELSLGIAALQIVKTMEEDVRRGAVSAAQFRENVTRVRPTTAWKNFEDAELVLDAMPGTVESKHALYLELERQIPHDAAVALAQPWCSPAELQGGMLHRERMASLHFPLPAGRTPLIEILVTPTTGAAAADRLRGFVATLGKTALVSGDDSGSIVQRVLYVGLGETLRLLEEGVHPERIEHAMLRFGMAYGPLEHLDTLGLDEFAVLAQRLQPILGDRLTNHPVVEHMVKQRWFGMKAGLGFYRHSAGKKGRHSALALWLRRTFLPSMQPLSLADQKKLVQQRIVGRMVNEAFRCLDEKLVANPSEADLALMLVGWAPHRGGPCRYAADVGFPQMVTTLDELAQKQGERFLPRAGLRALAELP